MMILNSFLNLQIHWIKQLKYLQENIDLAELKKILSKNDTRKSPKSKSISSQITVFKQLKNCIKHSLWPQKELFVWWVFFTSTANEEFWKLMGQNWQHLFFYPNMSTIFCDFFCVCQHTRQTVFVINAWPWSVFW